MKSLQKYYEFINNSKTDKFTELYLEGKISFKEWEINFDQINEGKIGDLLTNKVYPVLNQLKNKIKTVGLKGLNILKKIFNFIKTFAGKHPILAKILMIIIILFIIGIVTASAATGSDPHTLVANSDIINAAIGFIDDLHKAGDIADVMDKMQVQSYLMDMRDNGVIDSTWTEHIKTMGDAALSVVDDIKLENPKSFDKLASFGKELVDISIKYR